MNLERWILHNNTELQDEIQIFLIENNESGSDTPACPNLMTLRTSRYDQKEEFKPLQKKNVTLKAHDQPVYWSDTNLILFTGRRWVLANASKLLLDLPKASTASTTSSPTTKRGLRPTSHPSASPSHLPSTQPSLFPSRLPSQNPTRPRNIDPMVSPRLTPTAPSIASVAAPTIAPRAYKEAVEFFDGNSFHAMQFQGKDAILLVSDDDILLYFRVKPHELRWYEASYLNRNDWFPSAGQFKNDTKFACTICDTKFNPCLFDGECIGGNCICVPGTDGDLCEVPPFGNGECNTHFNEAKFGYDGGDCCGATCRGEACTEQEQKFLFGYEVEARGFPNCTNTDMVPISITLAGQELDFGRLRGNMDLLCDGSHYLPSYNYVETSSKETILVKDGAECTLRFRDIAVWDISSVRVVYEGDDDGTRQYTIVELATEPCFRIPFQNNTECASEIKRIKFFVISKGLLTALTDVLDFDELRDKNSPQLRGLRLLDSTETQNLVCDTKSLHQQFAMALLDVNRWFVPAMNTDALCSDGNVIKIESYSIKDETEVDNVETKGKLPTEIGLLAHLNEY